MKHILLFTFALLLSSFGAKAQKAKTPKVGNTTAPTQDVKAIKDMCGCYEVTFHFADTFGPDTNYKAHKAHLSKGIEWATVAEESPNKIAIQHILINNDTGIVKHWRQDWTYMPSSQYIFDRENTWRFTNLKPSKGQWLQQVFQVDDGPRYEGLATWVHADGKTYWESTTDSPLPRREFTTRTDYNVLKRRNRHQIMSNGWVHEQDNDKILREIGADNFVAAEKGVNTYVKIDDAKCKAAKEYWAKHQDYWKTVRSVWAKLYEKNQDFTLSKSVDGKPLFMYLFAMKPSSSRAEIEAVINKFYQKATLTPAKGAGLKLDNTISRK